MTEKEVLEQKMLLKKHLVERIQQIQQEIKVLEVRLAERMVRTRHDAGKRYGMEAKRI